MNIKLLRRIQRILKARPTQFDMSFWFDNAPTGNILRPNSPLIPTKPPVEHCGTTACIAGWALTLAETKKGHKATPRKVALKCGIAKNGRSSYRLSPVSIKAAEALGITFLQGEKLFFMYNWPKNFQDLFANEKTRVEVAIARIEHFIKTDGAE